MTVLEMRAEIHKAIDELPEAILPELLLYVKQLQKSAAEKDDINRFIEKVFEEDHNLLKRLAD